jgi:2-(1,2-epoxy-1,2-dihydrophenyl)acetyl-CoA isomerase
MIAIDIPTGSTDLLASLAEGILTVKLNRPEARNALSWSMLEALVEVLTDAETNPDVKCLVLTGTGKGFCAGGDVKAMVQSGNGAAFGGEVDDLIHKQQLVQRATSGKLFSMPKPTIAMINGAAAGAGLSLALACDLRVMSSEAVLSTAFARVGLPGDFGGAYFMSKLIGTAKARELYFFSDRVNAEEALNLGLANSIAAPDRLYDETMAVAARLAAGPGIALRYMKKNLNRALEGEMGECLDLEATHHIRCAATEDHRGAILAFVEGREPVFAGK